MRGCRAAPHQPGGAPPRAALRLPRPQTNPYSGERYELLPGHMDELRALAVPVTAPRAALGAATAGGRGARLSQGAGRIPLCPSLPWSAAAITPSQASSVTPPRSSVSSGSSYNRRWPPSSNRCWATAQAGLTYSRDPLDIARFEALRAATVMLIASQSEQAPPTPSATGFPSTAAILPPSSMCGPSFRTMRAISVGAGAQ